MTALEKYQRLECGALWRETPDGQRREVVLSIGEATLTISDAQDRPLAHWSIAALTRANPDTLPAIYHPDGDPGETLELDASEGEMIDCLETLRGAVARRRPRKGRLRIWLTTAAVGCVVAAGVIWLPGLLREQALRVLPPAKRTEIGMTLMSEMRPVTGAACTASGGTEALSRLAERLTPDGQTPPTLVVVPGGIQGTLVLPGGLILIDNAVLEQTEDPEAVAGIILASTLRARASDPMEGVLRAAGTFSVMRLLTTGDLQKGSLRGYARRLPALPVHPLPPSELLQAFRMAGLQSRPFALTLPKDDPRLDTLMKGDPYPDGSPDPILSDGDWLRLQGICIS